jgi:Zn2+/Cd2+-exporting ATPase
MSNEAVVVTDERAANTLTYKIEGLSCIDCAGRIEAAVRRLDGVEDAEVNHATGTLSLRAHAPDFDLAPVVKIVQDTGHKLVTEATPSQISGGLVGFVRFLMSSSATLLTAVAALLSVAGLIALWMGLPDGISTSLFALAIVTGGSPVARHAFQEVWVARRLGINTLMVIAVTGAMVIGEWAEAAIVVVLFSLGEALEGFAAERARGALETLLELAPAVALRLGPDDSVVEVPVASLAVGERVVIRPGDRVSVDGVVRAGSSAVDQAAITGESMPVDKAPGDAVFAGTINLEGALEVAVSKRATETTLSRMVALVREAQARQAPVQRFVDRFASVYTPVVAAIAVLVAAVPPLLFGQPFLGDHGWLMRALQMLVIACPCALVISTPVTVVSALTNAAARGVLIKGGSTLEALGRVRVFAFDKTGTLTAGKPVITDHLKVCDDTSHVHEGLSYAAALEAQSSHPLARALVKEAEGQKVAAYTSSDVSLLSGRGVTGRVNGRQVTVASHRYFDEAVPHDEVVCLDADRLSAAGKTVVMVCHDESVCSIFAVADTPRPESAEIISALREAGDIRTVMLTGDGAVVAGAIGARLGVDEVRADLLPEDKVAAVRALSAEGLVAMVGDGVNDAPALAEAAVGIAMGGAGSDQAMETADVVLMGDDLHQLPFLLRLSRRTQRVIRANISIALGVKALVFVLAALGVATLWMAIAADVGASLVVILNGMRLRQGEG